MALSRREMNAAKRGKRGKREQFGPAFPVVRSNANTGQAGQSFGALDHGDAVKGISANTGMRKHEKPKRNTMSRRFMSTFNPGTSAGYATRPAQPADERWTPQGAHHVSQPRISSPARVRDVPADRPVTIIRMGDFE